jgi:hypothetical protein
LRLEDFTKIFLENLEQWGKNKRGEQSRLWGLLFEWVGEKHIAFWSAIEAQVAMRAKEEGLSDEEFLKKLFAAKNSDEFMDILVKWNFSQPPL